MSDTVDISGRPVNGRVGLSFRKFDKKVKQWIKTHYKHMASDEERPVAVSQFAMLWRWIAGGEHCTTLRKSTGAANCLCSSPSATTAAAGAARFSSP